MIRATAMAIACAALTGCGAHALDEIGIPPNMSPVGAGLNGEQNAIYSYPEKPSPQVKKFSLWDDRQSRLFTDARALSAGDLLTILISINDSAKFKNESERNRTSSKTMGIGGSYDVDGTGSSAQLDGNIDSETDSTGSGQTNRSERIDFRVAAVVTEVLPNGNLKISGSQEVRVNAELRVLTIAGIVRPSDIGSNNTISYERIAEARVSYGGRGRLTEVQQPPYGQQILDTVLPF